MKKNDYLSCEVQAFIAWLAAHLDDVTLKHHYLNRDLKQNWECTSLYAAYSGYHWSHDGVERLGVLPGKDFGSSAEALDALRDELVRALTEKNDEATRKVCEDIVIWGGVGHGSVSWLRENQSSLAALISATQEAIDCGDVNHTLLTDDRLRFNAGMTKVYSLTCRELIIYDSRVAAALGWAVVKYCKEMNLKQVPAKLRFPWAQANDGGSRRVPKRRDPSEGAFVFRKLSSGPLHAEWNKNSTTCSGTCQRISTGAHFPWRIVRIEYGAEKKGMDLVRRCS